MVHDRAFILGVSAIAVTVLLYLLPRFWRFTKELCAAIRRQGEMGKIMSQGDLTAGVYTVLAVRDLYDGMYHGVKVLAEAKDGARCVLWTLCEPCAQNDLPLPCQFFDTIDRGDRISVFVEGDGDIRVTLFYG